MAQTETELRQAVVAAARQMNALGINQGTSGNIGVRFDDAMLITPSGVPYDQMAPEDLPRTPLAGECGAWEGGSRPRRSGAFTSTS